MIPSSILGKTELNSFVKLNLIYATKVEIIDDLLHIRKKIDSKHIQVRGTEILLFRIKTEDNMLAVNRVFVTLVRGSGYPRVPCLRKQLPPHRWATTSHVSGSQNANMYHIKNRDTVETLLMV